MDAMIKYPSLKLTVTDSALPTLLVKDNKVKISYNLLKADAIYSTLGETIASILAYPPKETNEVWSELDKLIVYYQEKTVSDAIRELARAMEILAPNARISPLYPLARKTEISDGLLAKLYTIMEAEPEEKSRVIEEYKGIMNMIEGIEYQDGFYYIENIEKIYNKAMSKLIVPPLNITRAMAANLVKIVKSKIRGPELRLTGSYLSVDSTRINLKCEKPEEIVKDHLKCREKVRCSQGHIISSSVLCECQDKKLVVKDYARMGGKWVILKIMAKPMIEYRISPKARMITEYTVMRNLADIEGVKTPFFYELCSSTSQKAMAVREYINGTILRESNKPVDWSESGETLGIIHSHGVTLGDANPGNFILIPGKDIGILDAEQSYDYSLKTAAWDIVTFISTSIFWRKNTNLIMDFLKGYTREAPEPFNVFEEASKAYTWIGVLPTVPHIYVQSKRILGQLLESVKRRT